MLQCSLVQTGQGASDAINIGDVVAERDDVIARNRDPLGRVDGGRSSGTRVSRGTGCVLTGSDGKDGHSKWNKPLHESPPGTGMPDGPAYPSTSVDGQLGWGISMTNPRH